MRKKERRLKTGLLSYWRVRKKGEGISKEVPSPSVKPEVPSKMQPKFKSFYFSHYLPLRCYLETFSYF